MNPSSPIGQIGLYRVVDLSKPIDPHTSTRRCRMRRFYQESTKDYHTDLDVESHLGTHVETPFHYHDDWKDILGLPVTAFMGRAILLRLECGPREPVTRAMLDRAARGRVQAGDIVLLDSPFQCEPFSNDPDDQRPFLFAESGDWCVEKRIKCLGFGDGVAIESSVKTACEMHERLLLHDILMLEVVKNLDLLKRDVFLLVYQPMPIKGLDSCCVRAVAIEGIPGFCE